MKNLILACSLLLVIATISEAASPTIPLFVWSNNKIFSRQGEQFLDTITEKDIESSLYALLGFKTESFISTVQSNPEAVVLFVEPQLQTDQIPHFGAAYATSPNGGAFSGLKELMEKSGSSIVAPYATTEYSFSLLDSLLSRVALKAPILFVRSKGSSLFHELDSVSNVQSISLEEFNGDLELFSNGKPDLIVVCLDKAVDFEQLAVHDEIIGLVSSLVSRVTSGNYVGMYTGNAAPPSNTLWTFPNPNAALFEQPQLYSTYENIDPIVPGNYTTRTYLTGPIIETFMVVIALLSMIFIGVCNICSLQVPETFETPKQQKQM